ncbi:MAG: ABC transporter ATP-binding protein [Candidatus Bathyarchaeia archaeon]
MLHCIDVSKGFGGVQALKNVNLTINKNEIAGLVGPNGSGKSTLLNVISGIHKPDSGRVLFMGEDISKLPPYSVCAKGIAKTSQSVQSFPEMTTLENVLVGVAFGAANKEKQDPIDKAKELLRFVGLKEDKFDIPAKNLNVIELRRVQLARALATKPKLLLLDELLTGLTPKECDEAIALVKLVNKQGITVLMVEHVMRIIMGLCDRVTVLHHGEKICEGPPNEVCNNKDVIRVYLGKRFSLDEE